MDRKFSKQNKVIRSVCKKLSPKGYLNATENLMVDSKNKVAFCRNAKVGTVTWLRHFAQLDPEKRFAVHHEEEYIHDEIPRLFSLQNQLKKKCSKEKSLLHCLRSRNYLLFSFVRHPFDRIVSAYIDKVEIPKYMFRMLKKLYGKYDFLTFLEHILQSFDGLVKMDIHWTPFYKRCDYCNFVYNVVGRSETFEEDAK